MSFLANSVKKFFSNLLHCFVVTLSVRRVFMKKILRAVLYVVPQLQEKN